VLEIGVVLLDDHGDVEAEWSTLVNPGRDVGPTHIHGVTAREVLKAPVFADLAPLVLRCVAGRTLVAHNASFDVRFLRHELARSGYSWTGPDIPALCTMELAGRFLDVPSRRLSHCCRAAAIDVSAQHEALADARLVAALLAHMMRTSPPPPPWSAHHRAAQDYAWPMCDDDTVPSFVGRTSGAPVREELWLDRVTAAMPRHGDVRVDAYLAVLESAMLDRYLSAHEEDALVDTASVIGLDRTRLDAVHRDYLLTLASVAWSDRLITRTELDELETVARLLGLGTQDVATSLDAAKAATNAPVGATFQLEQGDQVCLTGQMTHPRESIEALLHTRGLRVGGLTRSSRLLVAADPDSLSGKAAKARSYGIPIVTEAALLGLLLTMAD
jgi:DNA polymerase-3 subunit epsilon